jgi:AcrR family transcriptional regulator
LAGSRDATALTADTEEMPAPPRRRDAAQTRLLLLDVARGRFARDGYASTTVRAIADEARVNVALISRYFTSKEGLFEACLAAAVSDIRDDSRVGSRDDLSAAMARRIAGTAHTPRAHEALLLLLRSSGNERVDDMRRGVLRSATEHLVVAACGRPVTADDDPLLLRAQIVIATAVGMVLMRSAIGVPPVSSAVDQDLIGPLSDLINALLPAQIR